MSGHIYGMNGIDKGTNGVIDTANLAVEPLVFIAIPVME